MGLWYELGLGPGLWIRVRIKVKNQVIRTAVRILVMDK